RFHSGEALVPKLDLLTCMSGHQLGELARILGLNACVPTHVQRLADQNQIHRFLLRNAGKRRQIGAIVLSLEGGETLRRDTKLVAEGQADPPPAEVEGKNSHV